MLKDFDSIFGTLLPNTNAKLEPPQGMDETEGLEIKAKNCWKKDEDRWITVAFLWCLVVDLLGSTLIDFDIHILMISHISKSYPIARSI